MFEFLTSVAEAASQCVCAQDVLKDFPAQKCLEKENLFSIPIDPSMSASEDLTWSATPQNLTNSPASSKVYVFIHPSLTAKPSTNEFSSEHVRPFPKAPPRKSARNTIKRKSTIYTDTPEKENIRLQTEERDRRKNASKVKNNLKNIEKKKRKTNTKKKTRQRNPKNVSSSSEDEQEPYFGEDDDESVYDVNEEMDQLDSSSCKSDTDDGSSVPQLGIP